jgi:hypothetical protein
MTSIQGASILKGNAFQGQRFLRLLTSKVIIEKQQYFPA